MKNKKIIACVLAISMLIAGCGNDAGSKNNQSQDDTYVAKFDINDIIEKTDVEEFEKNHEGYYLEFYTGKDMETCTIVNYKSIKELPECQEMVEYGLASLNIDEVVYYVYFLEGDNYYSAEYDKDTKELLVENGEWFLDVDKDTKINSMLDMIDEVIK